MLLCVCCKDHVHLVLGEGPVEKREPGQFSWPIFTQNEVKMHEKHTLDEAGRTEQDLEEIREFFARVYKRLQVQGRDAKGQFTKKYLRKDYRDSLPQYGSLIEEWLDFADGKKKMCNFILHQVPIWNVIITPLYDCSLIRYIKPPPNTHSYKGYDWEGVFEIPPNLEIL